MKNIGIYIDHYYRIPFFLRFVLGLKKSHCLPVIFTCKLSIFLRFRRYSQYVYLIKDNLGISEKNHDISSIERIKQVQSASFASSIYSNTKHCLEQIDHSMHIDLFCLWNGSNTCDQAIREFAEKNQRATLFFEIANFSGKMFVDPKGVNAKSWLYDNPDQLDNLAVDQLAFDDWLERTISDKKKNPPKQVRFLKKVNLWSLCDRLGYLFFHAQRLDQTAFMVQLKRFVKRKKLNLSFDHPQLEQDYVFLPLQVCDDTQLLLNSPFNNLDAIKMAKTEAEQLGCKLFVKPHPAESNINFLQQLLQLKGQYEFFLVNENTIDLITQARHVVTINSTVGLEAMLLDIPVTILGEAVYKIFNRKRIQSYIQNFLLDCDYFENSQNPVSADFIQRCFRRASYQVI